MDLNHFIGFTITMVGLMGSIFLIKGILRITPEVMGDLGTTKLGYSSSTLDNLSSQKADVLVGFYLIIIAFIPQILREIFKLERIKVFPDFPTGIFCSFFIVILLGYIFWNLNQRIKKSFRIASGEAIAKEFIIKPLINLDLTKSGVPNEIENNARNLIFFQRGLGESDQAFIERLSKRLGIPAPNSKV